MGEETSAFFVITTTKIQSGGIKMTYKVPPKVEDTVRREELEIRERLALAQDCPLRGYVTQEMVQNSGPEEYAGDMLCWGQTRARKIGGCCALREEFCYLDRGSKKQPRVQSKDECPVYHRVVEVLAAIK